MGIYYFSKGRVLKSTNCKHASLCPSMPPTDSLFVGRSGLTPHPPGPQNSSKESSPKVPKLKTSFESILRAPGHQLIEYSQTRQLFSEPRILSKGPPIWCLRRRVRVGAGARAGRSRRGGAETVLQRAELGERKNHTVVTRCVTRITESAESDKPMN
jgi:hypothetical protein